MEKARSEGAQVRSAQGGGEKPSEHSEIEQPENGVVNCVAEPAAELRRGLPVVRAVRDNAGAHLYFLHFSPQRAWA